MSLLDVYLEQPLAYRPAPRERIFIREGGASVEVTRDEWDTRFPGHEPVVLLDDDERCDVYSANITHNLGKMAEECGLYEPLWHPDEIGITHAHQLVEPLRAGLEKLRSDPGRFKSFNPANGWGDYDLLVSFTEDYLNACVTYPHAEVHVWR